MPLETTSPSLGRAILNKVPEVTLFFWIIKVLGTTVGETAADFLNVNLNFGLTGTSIERVQFNQRIRQFMVTPIRVFIAYGIA